MNGNIKVISEMNKETLWKEFCFSTYPKWGSMCLLSYLNFRVLDTAFIEPSSSLSDIQKILERFASVRNLERVLIRTDGGGEIGDYMRGGNSYEISHAYELISRIISIGRSVLLETPTNRFTNKLALNLDLDANGYFRIEALGPGFDVSDINRGLITPEIFIEISLIDWKKFDRFHPLLIKRVKSDSTEFEKKRKLRLHRIGKELLPAIGIQTSEPIDKFAQKWLQENRYLQLFENDHPKIQLEHIKEWYEMAFLVAITYMRRFKWENLVISASDLDDNKGLVYWEIVNPKKKFRL